MQPPSHLVEMMGFVCITSLILGLIDLSIKLPLNNSWVGPSFRVVPEIAISPNDLSQLDNQNVLLCIAFDGNLLQCVDVSRSIRLDSAPSGWHSIKVWLKLPAGKKLLI
jgi:hypothetical protein